MKGKLGLACCAATLFVMCGVAKADDIVRANNQFSVDFAAVNFGYKETAPGGAPLDSESASSAPGVSATISLMQDWGLRNVYFMARYTYFNGNTAYDGAAARLARSRTRMARRSTMSMSVSAKDLASAPASC
jgi:hypothetical protein